MHKKRNASTIILLLTIIWGTASAAGSFDPCGLLTKAEVEALVGEPVKDSETKETKNPLGQKMCLYTTVSSSRLIQVSSIFSENHARLSLTGMVLLFFVFMDGIGTITAFRLVCIS